jgi:DNA modification methylase
MQAQATVQNRFIDSITQGDCIQVMREMPANSVDFILTDPVARQNSDLLLNHDD